MDGGDCRAGVVVDAASDDRHMDVLGLELLHKVANVDGDIHHEQVGAAAGTQHGVRLRDVLGVSDGGALVHRDLGCGGELAVERADDQETHGEAPLTFFI